MPIDSSPLAQLVAEYMDDLEDEHDGDVTLGIVAIVVEVNGDDWTAVQYRCSDERRWVQLGLFDAAKRAVDAGPGDDDEED